MPDNEATLVARIKTLYVRRHEDKLVMQKDMATLRDKYDWTQQMITDATGIPQPTVHRWLKAYDDGIIHVNNPPRLTVKEDKARSDRAVAKRVLAEATPEQVRDLLDQPNVIPKVVAAAAALNPKPVDIRSEAEKKADEAEEAEFEEKAGKLQGRFKHPSFFIKSAIKEVKFFIEHDATMEDTEYAQSVAAGMQLLHELWVYGAQRGYDVSQLTHELERWQEMLDGEDE